jgi:UPF0755 protein
MIRRLIAIGALVAVIFVLWFLVSLTQPFAGSGSGRVDVVIPRDASTSQIADLLANDGVISSSFFFEIRAKLGGDSFRAGTFVLAHGMSYSAALSALTTSTGIVETPVTIIPGKSRWQINRLLSSEGVKGSYLKDTVTVPGFSPSAYGAPKHPVSLEGFLYPDTYELRPPLSIPALVADQLAQFKREMATVDFRYAESKNLTPYDVLKIASLEEAEAFTPADLPRVASVIYNRLRDGMSLGLDTTVAYIFNNYSGNLTNAQLASKSPWNTTNHLGLPPTPIDSPSINAIRAAAHPATTDYLYFIVKVCGDGSLAFATNINTFNQLTAAYNAAVAKHGQDKAEFCGHG